MTRTAASLRRGDGYVDQLVLGRLRPTWTPPPPPGEERPPVLPERRPAPASVHVRPVVEGDAAAVHALMSAPEVVWGTLQTPLQSPDHSRRRLAANDPALDCLLAVEADGELAGMIGLHRGRLPGRDHCGGLGMAVAPSHQGRGLGGRLVDAALEQADAMGLHRVFLELYDDNVRARRLYESRGFLREGVQRAATWRDGRFVDNVVMARVRGEPATPPLRTSS